MTSHGSQTRSGTLIVKRRQRARMSGNTELAKKLRNKVNRSASHLRHDIYKSKISSLENSSSKDWWKHMKSLMGLSNGRNTGLQGLACKHSDLCPSHISSDYRQNVFPMLKRAKILDNRRVTDRYSVDIGR